MDLSQGQRQHSAVTQCAANGSSDAKRQHIVPSQGSATDRPSITKSLLREESFEGFASDQNHGRRQHTTLSSAEVALDQGSARDRPSITKSLLRMKALDGFSIDQHIAT